MQDAICSHQIVLDILFLFCTQPCISNNREYFSELSQTYTHLVLASIKMLGFIHVSVRPGFFFGTKFYISKYRILLNDSAKIKYCRCMYLLSFI